MQTWMWIPIILVGVLGLFPLIVSAFLRNVDAGTVRLVSWLNGYTAIYRGPGKSKEIPLLTTGTTISSKVINVDLDITDQTADVDDSAVPRPIKVRVLASAIVSVGDTDTLIKTAANRFFAKPEEDQTSTLTDLLSSSARRAINLLTHDQLFSARSAAPRTHDAGLPVPVTTGRALQADGQDDVTAEDDDPLAIIIRKACSRELTDLGLVFNSLNIKAVQSEVADARRRQSAAEAQANADIVSAQQSRRAKEAQLEAERAISDKQRELELDATQVAQAKADGEGVQIEAQGAAQADAMKIKTVAEATAESIRRINEAIQVGGENYFRYRQIEMLPQIAPAVAAALAQAKLITIARGEGAGAPETAANNIKSVIQSMLAAQLITRARLLGDTRGDR